MAPGRKRGGRGSNANCDLTLGDLVLAKVKGFPAWPAKISRPEDWDRTVDPKKYFVQFYGTAEIAYVAPPDIQKFTTEIKNKVLARCKSKTVKYFTQAVEEINEAFEELERRKSSGEREDTDDAAVDDNVEIDLKDIIDTQKLYGDTRSKGLDDDVTTPECLSPLQEISDCQDVKSSISGDTKDGLSPLVSNDDAELPVKDEDRVYLSAVKEPFCDEETKDNAVQKSPSTSIRSSYHVDLPKEELISESKSEKVFIKSKKKSGRPLEGNKVNVKTSLPSPEDSKNFKPKKRRREESGGSEKEKFCPIVKLRGDSVSGKKAKRLSDDATGEVNGKDQADVSGRKSRGKCVTEKHNLVSDEVTHKVKRSKYEDKELDLTKAPPQTRRIVNQETDISKNKQSKLQVKTENKLDPNISGNEDNLPPVKRRRRAPEVLSEGKKGKSQIVPQNSGSCSDKVKSPGTQTISKRRAVLLDDSDEEDNTSVCVGSTTRVDASLNVSEPDEKTHVNSKIHYKPSEGVSEEIGSMEKVLPIPRQNVGTPKNAMFSPSKPKSELGKVCSKKEKPDLVSPRMSTPGVEPLKAVKSSGKVSVSATHKKVQTGSNNGHTVVSNGSSKSQIQAASGRSKPSSSGTKQKSSSISNSRPNDSTPVAGELFERVEADTEDKANSLRHLIEVAKKRQADSQNFPHGYSTSLLGDVPPYLLGTSLMQLDPRTPSSHINSEILDERRVGSGPRLGGGSEATAARIAFEGSVDTLSRTKDSIGRATLLAMDCAKFGIADEVVELLIRKMEFEPRFHRRVDLFFLVDSITQCSHGHKGGSGSSYIPSVEAALPRLLKAAAPSGVGAHDNRHQCRKVLRLWIQRKIFPESLLRQHMDELRVPKDDPSAVIFQKRSSRSERSIDDPVREMEGMLVDEYGSNAAFQLPGLLSSCIFEEEEEEEEEDDAGKVLGVDGGITPKEEEGETISPPNDRRHFVLEDVDGELEMEDVSASPPEEQELQAQTATSTTSESVEDEKKKKKKKGGLTPPLPEGSPPRTPPMPCSTSPPPPPPLQPLPLQHHLPLPPPPPLAMLPPHLHPSSSSSPIFPYHLISHDSNVNQPAHMHQQSPCFLPPPPPPPAGGGVLNPQPPHCPPPLAQNGFQPLTHSQFSYSIPPRVHQYPHPPPRLPIPQQQQHHRYPPPYSLRPPPPPLNQHHHHYHHDGPRHFVAPEDQWRMMPPNNFNHNAQPAAVWHNGPEGYFRPPPPPPPPPPIAGPAVPQMMPCRPDMPSQGCWRPA